MEELNKMSSAKAGETSAVNSYDEIPYHDFPYSFTHIRHLETMAVLFGMSPPDIRTARVLEMGCAAGGNLIPQAIDFPNSHFLGIDLSQRQIEDGCRLIESLNLSNISIRQANILDIDESWGKFDYIIAHGVFSWVPTDVQHHLLRVCSTNLAPNGVAIVTYNIYPGWRMASVVRDLMQYHCAGFPDPRVRIAQAKAILEFLVSLDIDGAMGQLYRNELAAIKQVNNDTYLFHEHLEDQNNPVYFHQFMQIAQSAGLQYLADAEFSTMLLQNAPAKVRETFARLPLLQQEQYLDFIRGRRFRKTLLCHANVALNREITPESIVGFHFALDGACELADFVIRDESTAELRRGSSVLRSSQHLVKAACVFLKEISPRYISFRDLYLTARARTQAACRFPADHPALAQEVLSCALLTGISVGIFDFCLRPAQWVDRASRTPTVRPLVRLQAEMGKVLTNLCHRPVQLNDLCRKLVLRLDGRHDRSSLIPCLKEAVDRGEIVVKQRDKPLKNPPPEALAELLDQTLGEIAEARLLVQ